MQPLQERLAGKGPIIDTRFDGEEMQEAHIAEAEFRNCRFSNCTFDEATFRACRFYGCVFDHCSFREARIEDCQFCEGEIGTQWRYCDLSKAEIRRSNLSLNTMVGSTAYLTVFSDCSAAGIRLDLETQRKIRTQIMAGGVIFRTASCNMPCFPRPIFAKACLKAAICAMQALPAAT